MKNVANTAEKELLSQFRKTVSKIDKAKSDLDLYYGEVLKCIELLQGTLSPGLLTYLKDVPKYDSTYRWLGVKLFNKKHNAHPCGVRDIRDFKKNLSKNFPVVSEFNFAEYGLIIAGGFVTSLLESTPSAGGPPRYEFGDVDFFMIEPFTDSPRVCTSPEERACDAARGLSEYLKKCRDSGQVKNVRKFRTSGSVTFLFDRCVAPRMYVSTQFQIILREYSSVEKVIGTFDIGACSVAYTGDDVVFTAQAVEEHRSGCITYNPNANETTVRRVEKYMTRGWGLYLKHTRDEHVAKLMTSAACALTKNICLYAKMDKDDGYWHPGAHSRFTLGLSSEISFDARAEGDDYVIRKSIDFASFDPSYNAKSISEGKTGYCAEAPCIDTPLTEIDLDYRSINKFLLKKALRNPLWSLANNLQYVLCAPSLKKGSSDLAILMEIVVPDLGNLLSATSDALDSYLELREIHHRMPFEVKGNMVKTLCKPIFTDEEAYGANYVE